MAFDERALARIRKHLAEEYPGGLSATDFVWKFLSEEDRRIGLGRPLERFDEIHQGFRKEIKKLPVSQAGEKVNLADELKSAAASYGDRSILIEAWLLELDQKLSSVAGNSRNTKGAAPEIVSFEADKTSVAANGTVALRWRTQNTTSVVLEQKTETETVLMSRVVDATGTWNVTGIGQNCVFELKAIQAASIVSRRVVVKVRAEPGARPPEEKPAGPKPFAPNPFAPKPAAPKPAAPKPFAPNPFAPNPFAPRPVREDLAIRTYSVTPQRPKKGGEVVVEWSVSGAASAALELRANGRSISKFNVPSFGTHRFANIQSPALVELTASGFDGTTVQQTTRISIARSYRWPMVAALVVLLLVVAALLLRGFSSRRVEPAPAEIVSLEARPVAVRAGGKVTLQWQTNNAVQAHLNGRPVAASGSLTIPHVYRSSTFVLDAANADGAEVRRSIEVGVRSPQAPAPMPVPISPSPAPAPAPEVAIESFSATPDRIERGQSTVLHWSVRDATVVAIDQSVGTVTGDQIAVRPEVTTTYTLSASGGGKQKTASARVVVNEAEVSPAPPQSAQSGVLHCQGVSVPPNGRVVFEHLPGGYLHFEVDPPGAWAILPQKQPDGSQRITLISRLPQVQTSCTVRWELLR